MTVADCRAGKKAAAGFFGRTEDEAKNAQAFLRRVYGRYSRVKGKSRGMKEKKGNTGATTPIEAWKAA